MTYCAITKSLENGQKAGTLMKKLMILTIVLFQFCLLTSASHAAQHQCRENGAGPDNGYIVSVSSNGGEATIQQETIAGPQTLATLTCVKPRGNSRRTGSLAVILTCSEPQIRDGGYSLVITQGGVTGLTNATVYQETIMGAKTLAQLLCN